MDPDIGGPKTCGSGFGSGTLSVREGDKGGCVRYLVSLLAEERVALPRVDTPDHAAPRPPGSAAVGRRAARQADHVRHRSGRDLKHNKCRL